MSGPTTTSAELAKALADRPVDTCLWVGEAGAFLSVLNGLVSGDGEACVIYAVAASGVDGAANLSRDAYRVAGPAVASHDFPKLTDVIAYARTQEDPARPIERFTLALARAKAAAGTDHSALDRIAADVSLHRLDLVVLDGEDVLSERIVRRSRGSSAFLFDGTTTTFGGSAAFASLSGDAAYRLAAEGGEDGGWALFVLREPTRQHLPIHFFTIVLNGEPFIRYHETMLFELDGPWHWHVVEGVAPLVEDAASGTGADGRIQDDLHREGRSNDGTSEYLDELARRFPRRVSLYRKPPGVFWDGRPDMVNAPVSGITEPCLLWHLGSDELWTADQVESVRRCFIEQPDRGAAAFWCNDFVGPELGVSTRPGHAQQSQRDALRVWRFDPGMAWDTHEQPTLRGVDRNGASYDAGEKTPFSRREMEAIGAVFDRFGYATAEQARFKEACHGHRCAATQWSALQRHGGGSGHLRDYFAWVPDETMFDTVARLDWTPVAFMHPDTRRWTFRDGEAMRVARRARRAGRGLKILVDGVFFQLDKSGIARVWTNLLREWSRSGFGEHVVLLDRAGTAPRLDGIIYRTIERHDWDSIDADARYLQEICDREGADLFMSTYYTTPTRTPSVFFGHDMIPEIMGSDLHNNWWQQKRRAIQHAVGHVMVSGNSANDLCTVHPDLDRETILVAYNSVDRAFGPCDPQEVRDFRDRYGLERDFVMLVGDRSGWKGYKNGSVVFAALGQMPRERRPLLVCVGGAPQLEDVGRVLLGEDDVRLLELDDEDLCLCYAAAFAYICPSLIEGFGLPVAEAMTVGCPVLVCRNSSIPEVAGEAGLYFDPNDPGSLVAAIQSLHDPGRRAAAVEAGRKQVAKFDLATSARQIAEYCRETAEKVRSGDLRVSAQALADAFENAERRRLAEEQVERLGRSVAELTSELSSRSGRAPIPPGRVESQVGGPVASIGAGHPDGRAPSPMTAIERRLAAYGGLPDRGHPLPASTARQSPPKPASCRLAETEGLAPLEGPYPELAITRSFRRQTVSRSVFTFVSPDETTAWLEIEFASPEEGRTVRVHMDSFLLAEATTSQAGWQHVWRIVVPVTLRRGNNRVEFEAVEPVDVEKGGPVPPLAVYRARMTPRWSDAGDETDRAFSELPTIGPS